MNWMEIIKSFGAGLFVGALFTILKLPVPAPPVLAGIMGIVGIFTGYLLVGYLTK